MSAPDYTQWSVEQLAERVKALEKGLRDANAKYLAAVHPSRPSTPSSPEKKAGARKAFDPTRYSSRLIALKFAYLGQNYNGLEYNANNPTPVPTIEEELWRALMKAHLIFPKDAEAVERGKVTWDGCEYSKCGRTDRGVSAFGQVVGLRVRSNKPVSKRREEAADFEDKHMQEQEHNVSPYDGLGEPAGFNGLTEPPEEEPSFHPIRDEIPYAQVLNRLLPPDIRALAWCPTPSSDFSARFSCRERHYRYFFTQPAFNPTYGASGLAASLSYDRSTRERRREGWLDIEAMKDAAKRYEGLHDFRNFCKVDASKQLQDFKRRIFRSEIAEVDPTSEAAAYIAGSAFAEFEGNPQRLANGGNHLDGLQSPAPKVYQFILHGSAFLWHQVRHMVAILFLIGQGLEKPELVDHLLDIKKNPQKPHYEMADDAPLVLWDCIFPAEGSTGREDALEWLWIGAQHGAGDEGLHVTSGFRGPGKLGVGGLVDDMWELWRKKKIDEVLAGSLLNEVASQGRNGDGTTYSNPRPSSRKTYLGSDSYENRGVYTPVLARKRMEPVEVINQKWLAKKGRVERRKSEEALRQEMRTDHVDEGAE